MNHHLARSRVLSLLAFVAILGLATRIQSQSLDPRRHFPRDSWIFFDVDFNAALERFSESPLGKILHHPGVQLGLGQLPKMIISQIDQIEPSFEREFGVKVSGFAELFSGRAALAFFGDFDNRRGPEIVFAMDIEEKHREHAMRIAGLAAFEFSRTRESVTTKIRGSEFQHYASARGYTRDVHVGIVREQLVWVYGDSTADIIDRITGREKEDRLAANSNFAKTFSRDAAPPIATAFVDATRARKMFLDTMEAEGQSQITAQARAFLEATGLDKLDAAGVEVRFKDGDWASQLTLATSGQSGLLGALADGFGPTEDLSGFGKLPGSARSASAYSLHAGRICRAVRAFVGQMNEKMPELGRPLAGALGGVEDALGISVRSDLSVLPRLNIWSCQVDPPLGGLRSDVLAVLKLAEAAPYLGVVDKVLEHRGYEVPSLEIAGRPVAYVDLMAVAMAAIRDQNAPGFRMRLGMSELFLTQVVAGGSSVLFTPLDDEWLLVANSSQAIRRYFDGFSTDRSLAKEQTVMRLVKEQIRSDSAFQLFRGSSAFLSVYNSAVALLSRAAPVWRPQMESLGIEPAHFPAGETFADAFQDGYIAYSNRSGRIRWRSHRALSSFVSSPILRGAVPMLAVAGGVTFFDQGGMERRSERSAELERGEIARLHAYLVAYTKKPGNRAFPHDPKGSLESFQLLVDSGVISDLSHLVRRPSGDTPLLDPKQRIAKYNVSYELAPWKQGPSDVASRILAFDKRSFGRGGRYVLFVRGDIKFLPEVEFRRLFAEQKTRYGAKR